ncbi:LIM and calponin homology domains-containing protein 1 [Syngnathoides biaculeatus]|uniref:LIM and calponin homology domains-containing protein 1 n=1 Tax=Syngnathoides biaculeatus TaxID=300417 RepID=UPI002ADE921A|nr:LIM and calponin homology domains-containing protein 1 [Syngnathoides biaculeatus]
MASPEAHTGQSHQCQPVAASAFREAQKWIEAVTGRCFGDKNFRGGLENGILLCELLSSIKPGLVKKINRLPAPIAGLDNLSVFLRGCEELGLKGSQLFDPGDLQDTSTRPTAKQSDCSRKLKNVLITIYWLGRAANGCTSYNGPTLDLREFEGLLSQMRKEAEEAESPQRSIRDSGYIDCWESERSDSLSPPRHCREDSFDSLDSFGFRSQQTPSPDVLAARGSSDGHGSDSESDGPPLRKTPDIHKDDMLARRTSVSEPRTAVPFNQYLPNKCNQSGYVPAPARKLATRDKDGGERKSWSTATSPIGGERPLRSVSLIDMRSEDAAATAAAILPPHSHVRHELMHNQYNQMKEEDSHWQDDLARWKSRRRSISQDLIKKEEERKLMEQLMTGGQCVSHRRRSIKTYREIVEDKERREEELRAAYRGAKTPEEASSILQRYAQRFSVSETVMERLQLPKALDRSISSSSGFPASLSPTPVTPEPWENDPDGPLKYLRQQSAPAPRFTSTLETQVDEWPGGSPPRRPQIRSRSSEPPSDRVLSPKPLPLLTPKPYFQSWPATPEPWPSKADGLLPVNGKAGGDDPAAAPEDRGREPSPLFLPSSSPKTTSRNADSSVVGGSPASANPKDAETEIRGQEVGRCSTPPSRPTSLPVELLKPEESFGRKSDRQSESALVEETVEEKCESAPHRQTSAESKQETELSCQTGLGTHSITSVTNIHSCLQKNQKKEEGPFYGLLPPTATTEGFTNSTRLPLTTSNPNLRWEFFADKGEKDHRSNEKYQREQEKLKEEWEKAQREVAQEGRRYQEEERLILEETVTALSPQPSAPPPAEGDDAIVRSLADWERKQERLEKLSKASPENVECRLRENDRTSDISTADDSFRTARSSESQSGCLQNGQKLHQTAAKTSALAKKRPDADAGKPPGERRSAPASTDAGRSPSKPRSPSVDAPPNRSVSGKKLCSSCGQPLGKGAAMIIESLSLYFHIDCFKCGVCKGQLGDTSTGTDVRIRSGLLNCHQCYIRSRSAGQPTTL